MKLRASEIAERLAATAEQVAAMLLPGGKRQGHYWLAGDIGGGAGESLRVYLTGPKAGRWRDYAAEDEQGGDLIDLWAEVKRLEISAAMREAEEWLGVVSDPIREPRQSYALPQKRYGALSQGHLTWLAGRGITPATAEAFGCGSDGDWLALPSYVDGRLTRVKYRLTADKKFRQEPDCRPCLFGWQAVPERARSVCLVEGEMDALAMTQYGMPTLSVPDGGGAGGKQEGWIEHEYDRLQRFDTIYLALDQDDAGRYAAAEIMDRLGPDRCRLVELPHKDANKCLEKGLTKDDMRACFRHSRVVDPDELKRAADFRIELHDEFFGTPDEERGFGPPFESIRRELRFRPGETIVVAGPNGSGKSQLCGHFMLEAMRADYRGCIASMEFKAPRYLQRLGRQAGAIRQPTPEFLDAIIDWWDDKLWVFDLVGTAKRGRMLDVFRYARRRYNVRVFLVDNLAKCGLAEDDYNGQKAFIEDLTDFAKDTDSTVFLVHHMAKHGVGKAGVKGSGAITDMTDTLVIVWRNKAKEEALLADPEDADALGQPDGGIKCEKQRNGEHEPVKSIWFDRDSYQFLSGARSRPYRYVEWAGAASNQQEDAA